MDDVRTTNLVLRSDPAQGRDSFVVSAFSVFLFSSSSSLRLSLSTSLFCVSLLPVSLPVSLSPSLSPSKILRPFRPFRSFRSFRSPRLDSLRFA